MQHVDLYSLEYNAKVDAFYASFQWRKVRYTILKQSAGCCMLCNRSDLPLHVDHIKSLRENWHLRLRLDNLQVLCEECNHGKGNWDETDWRPDAKKKQQKVQYQRNKKQIEIRKQKSEADQIVETKQRQFVNNRRCVDAKEEQYKKMVKQAYRDAKRQRAKVIITIIKKQKRKLKQL